MFRCPAPRKAARSRVEQEDAAGCGRTDDELVPGLLQGESSSAMFRVL